jgi:hypothetical protein
MIAAVEAWRVALALLVLSIARGAAAADDPAAAARELARQTAALAGKGASVTVALRNASSLDPMATAQVRAAFELALEEAGAVASPIAPAVEASLTLSENPSQYLLVEVARKGEERQVWIAAWKRNGAPGGAPSPAAGAVALEKKLVWEQDEPILDAAFAAAGTLVLSPSKIILSTRTAGGPEQPKAVSITPARPQPRDPRGRLRVNGKSFQAYLPGTMCSGTADAGITVACHASEEPWVLESGSRDILLAGFAPARNYFDGQVVTQTGVRKTVPPFFSAASVEDQGRTWWVLALANGRAQLFDAALEAAGDLPAWGSDIAGADARCGAGPQVLATQPGDRGEPDAVQAFTLVNRSARAIAPPVSFAGPVTALWPSGGNAVLAVARDLRTGRYAAYVVSVVCGN